MSDRFTARRLDLRRRLWFKVTLGVLAVVVAGVLVWLVWFSSVVDARTVEVEGRVTLSQQQVRDAADVPLGGPLARVDLGAIEARVQQLARVRSVEVSRSWPHAVTITIVERTAVVWTRDAGEIRGIDRFGIDYRTYDEEPEGLVEAKIQATDAEVRLETIRAVAEIAQLLRTAKPAWADQVQAITGTTQDDVALDLTEGRTVVWGSPAQGPRKIEVLRTLLSIDATGYDVSAPDQPTTRD